MIEIFWYFAKTLDLAIMSWFDIIDKRVRYTDFD